MDFEGGFGTNIVEEGMDVNDHTGVVSASNQLASATGTPAKMLVFAWLFFLGLYWLLGYLFRGRTS
jgi:hypothetical protein